MFHCWLQKTISPGSWTSPRAGPGPLLASVWALERWGAGTWARLWVCRASAVSPLVSCQQGRVASPCAAAIGVVCGRAWGMLSAVPRGCQLVAGSRMGHPGSLAAFSIPMDSMAKMCGAVCMRLKPWCMQYCGIVSFLHVAAVYCASELPKYPRAHSQLQLRMDCFHQFFFFFRSHWVYSPTI